MESNAVEVATRKYTKVFKGNAEIGLDSMYEAESWLKDNGYSVSPRCEIDSQIVSGVIEGKNIHIPKFNKLNSVEHEQLTGKVVTTDKGVTRVILKTKPRKK